MPPILLHYETHDVSSDARARDGDESKPWILLVHGMLSSRSQWMLNLPTLTEHYRAVVIELLGHGRSPSPTTPESYTPQAYGAQFEAIRQLLGAERWYVVGQSLGAALSLRYTLDHPERVIAQVFTNSNSALAPPGWDDQIRPRIEKQADEYRRDGRDAILRNRLNPTAAKWLDDDVRAEFVKDVALHDPEGLAMTGVHTTVGSSVYTRAAETTVPTLLVVGEREERFAASRRYAEETFPDIRVVPTSAGHASNLGAPDQFNAAVLAFFAEHPPG
jgi:2-succinyl-6-hydroxy-2,4-cyclohexadiene-1-carboxylate synthase